MAWQIQVTKEGSLVIPCSILQACGIAPESAVTLKKESDRLTLTWQAEKWAERAKTALARLDQEIAEKLPDYPKDGTEVFLFGLTGQQYWALDEKERDRLWETESQKTEANLSKEPEIEIPTDFVPAGQRDSQKNSGGRQ
jgi:antitoxin component of MazEF toxin-antitoxin module